MDKERIGYLKYEGESVKDGFMDVRKQAEALLGFDDVLRYFISKEDPSLDQIKFEIPVRIQKGSIVADIGSLIINNSKEIITTTYLAQTAVVSAKDGFFESGLVKDSRKILKNSLIAIQWIIKISKHSGSIIGKKFKKVTPKEIDQQSFVELENNNGETLLSSKKYYDLFLKIPDKIFSKNARLIKNDRSFIIGVFKDDKEEVIKITDADRSVFYSKEDEANDEDDDEVILPEFEHGQQVSNLEGEITKVITSTNTLGFSYKDNIIECKPGSGRKVASYKNKIVSKEDGSLFSKVQITGIVDREDKNGDIKAKKPKIIFSEIIAIKHDKEPTLFDSQ